MTTYILVAGNNQTNLQLLKSAFASCDVEIVRAPGLSLALFLAKKNRPVLIISDLVLLDGDGVTFLQELKANKDMNAIPFMFLLPEKPKEPMKKNLLKNGAVAVLSNAIKPEELLVLLERFVQPAADLLSSTREDETTE
jgi:CheY-like chemotaxis protein